MAFRTVKLTANKKPLTASGDVLTDELKAKYANLQKRLDRVQIKQDINVRGRVYHIKGPFWHPFTFEGHTTWKKAFEVSGVLKPSDVEGIKLKVTIPASLNEKAHFSKLWLGATGTQADPDDEEADVSPIYVTQRDVNFVIRKGKQRKDGANWFNLRSFAPIWDDETGELKFPADTELVAEAWEEVEGENEAAMEAALAVEQATQAAAAALASQQEAADDSAPFETDESDLEFEE